MLSPEFHIIRQRRRSGIGPGVEFIPTERQKHPSARAIRVFWDKRVNKYGHFSYIAFIGTPQPPDWQCSFMETGQESGLVEPPKHPNARANHVFWDKRVNKYGHFSDAGHSVWLFFDPTGAGSSRNIRTVDEEKMTIHVPTWLSVISYQLFRKSAFESDADPTFDTDFGLDGFDTICGDKTQVRAQFAFFGTSGSINTGTSAKAH